MIRRVKSWSDCRDECNADESCEYFEYKVEFNFKYENCQALKNVAKNLKNVYFPINILEEIISELKKNLFPEEEEDCDQFDEEQQDITWGKKNCNKIYRFSGIISAKYS